MGYGEYPITVAQRLLNPTSIPLTKNICSVIILDRFAVNLVTTVRLDPEDPRQLLALIEHFNRTCNALSKLAFESKTFGWLALQRASYHWLRSEYGLNAAQAVVAVRKVAYAYSDHKRRGHIAKFAKRGAIPIYKHSFKRDGTLAFYGKRVPFRAAEGIPLSGKHEAQLIYRRRKFVLYQVYERPEGDLHEATDWLGCDLGIVNILTDSDEKNEPGGEIDELRRKYAHRLRNLQRKGTRAAKRKLHTIKGKQARFQRNFNHKLSKRVVAKALDTQRGIALEDLKGIRQRLTVRKPQRARHANWSFAQLRQMIEYKAALAGVPVTWVDPRNTSRTCPKCGHVAKANRPTRAKFKCVSCGFAGAADTVAAQNIRARARGDAPMVAETFQRQVSTLKG
jgi:putative transposase